MSKITPQIYFVYIHLCGNNTYYTGYTHNMVKRYQSHIDGTGRCKYTRSFKPLGIAQCLQVIRSKSLTMQLESKRKRLSRPEKERLIAHPATLSINEEVETYPPALLLNKPKDKANNNA